MLIFDFVEYVSISLAPLPSCFYYHFLSHFVDHSNGFSTSCWWIMAIYPRKWSILTALGADLLWQTRIHQGTTGTTIRRWPWTNVWCSLAAQLPPVSPCTLPRSQSISSETWGLAKSWDSCHSIFCIMLHFNPAPSSFTATTRNSYDELATSIESCVGCWNS